jgi:transposase
MFIFSIQPIGSFMNDQDLKKNIKKVTEEMPKDVWSLKRIREALQMRTGINFSSEHDKKRIKKVVVSLVFKKEQQSRKKKSRVFVDDDGTKYRVNMDDDDV